MTSLDRCVVRLVVEGNPVPQPRPRVDDGHAISAPRDHSVVAWKESIALALKQKYRGEPDGKQVFGVFAVFQLKRPQRPAHWLRRLIDTVWHSYRPDVDNLLKSVLDSVNGIIWRDDGQVAFAGAGKVYTAEGNSPHMELCIFRMDRAESPAAFFGTLLDMVSIERPVQ